MNIRLEYIISSDSRYSYVYCSSSSPLRQPSTIHLFYSPSSSPPRQPRTVHNPQQSETLISKPSVSGLPSKEKEAPPQLPTVAAPAPFLTVSQQSGPLISQPSVSGLPSKEKEATPQLPTIAAPPTITTIPEATTSTAVVSIDEYTEAMHTNITTTQAPVIAELLAVAQVPSPADFLHKDAHDLHLQYGETEAPESVHQQTHMETAGTGKEDSLVSPAAEEPASTSQPINITTNKWALIVDFTHPLHPNPSTTQEKQGVNCETNQPTFTTTNTLRGQLSTQPQNLASQLFVSP